MRRRQATGRRNARRLLATCLGAAALVALPGAAAVQAQAAPSSS